MNSYRNSETRPAIMAGSPPALVVPRAEWDQPPWNRWSFQHVRELLPTAEVWRGSAPARLLPRTERDLSGLKVAAVNGGPTTLTGLLDETYADGFIVIKDSAIVYERYFNGMTERTLHLSQSVAKSFTGALAGILAGRGVINPQALVTDYLSELSGTAYASATLQQVLDMTSGVRFDETYTDPYSEVGQIDVASGWRPPPPDADPAFIWPAHVFEVILRLKTLDRPHGQLFDYRSIETDVVAFCMERATGKRLPRLLSEEIWQKAGMEESACMTVDPADYALADGGLNACLRDFARLGLLYLDNGGGIIPPDWIEATRTGNHSIFGAPYTQTLPHGAYRNQWWIEDAEARSVIARGVFGQMIYVSWEHRMVVAKLSSWPDFINVPFNVATLKAIHSIAEHLM